MTTWDEWLDSLCLSNNTHSIEPLQFTSIMVWARVLKSPPNPIHFFKLKLCTSIDHLRKWPQQKNCKKGWLYSYNVLLNRICFNVDGFPSTLANYVKDYGRFFFIFSYLNMQNFVEEFHVYVVLLSPNLQNAVLLRNSTSWKCSPKDNCIILICIDFIIEWYIRMCSIIDYTFLSLNLF
jgi:hypothetical protein